MTTNADPRQHNRHANAIPVEAAVRPTQPVRIASIVALNLVPLVSTLWNLGSAGQFALLCLFNIVFAIMSGFFVNQAVTLLQAPARTVAALWGRIQPWVRLCLGTALFFGVLMVMFGWVVLAMVPHAGRELGDRHFWISMAVTAGVALPGLVAGAFADMRSGLSEGGRMARDRPAILLQLASGVALLILSSYAADWFDAVGLYPLMFALTAFFIFRDLRPDIIVRQLFPGN